MALFSGKTLDVAQRLIGARLVHESPEGLCSGRIVETEAYLATDDPASHSARGQTDRNRSMFLAAGRAYVYQIYGLHHCFNVVTNRAGIGEAVLIRALEPGEGLELMSQRRGVNDPRKLCNGPANLVQALGLTISHDGVNLAEGPLRIQLPAESLPPDTIVRGPRIGIRRAADLPYRYVLAGSPWLSRPAHTPVHTRPQRRG